MPSHTRQRRAVEADAERDAFVIGGTVVAPGKRQTVDLPLSLLSNHTPMTVPVRVLHGRQDGPRLFVCGAIHGDEINGVEIVRRLLKLVRVSRLRGSLIAAPIVNVHGFIGYTRYLPDRRDLNRSFPGSAGGSLAGQLANLFMSEVVARSTHGIDLHTGALHRTNFPQLRVDLGNAELARLAKAFAAPLVLDAALRDGSLRKAAMEVGVPTLVYEAGEALRFDELSIRVGVRGILRVMHSLGMIKKPNIGPSKVRPVLARSSHWVRAPASGILRVRMTPGARVNPGDRLGAIADPFGELEHEVTATQGGILIGRSNLPVVNQGDGLFHIARVVDADTAEEAMLKFTDELDQDDTLGELETI